MCGMTIERIIATCLYGACCYLKNMEPKMCFCVDKTYVRVYNMSMGVAILGRRLSISQSTVNSVHDRNLFWGNLLMRRTLSC